MELGPISKRDMYGEELGRIAEKMNLVHGTRVGWDDKQKYRDRLIEMVSQGVLTVGRVRRPDGMDGIRSD